MSTQLLVAYDDSETSRRALSLAAAHAESDGSTISIVHVLEWSPYSFLTPDELEERHKRRGEELARAESAITDAIKKTLGSSKVKTDLIIKYGHIADTIISVATEVGATEIFIGRTGQSSMSTRLFGSVAGSLAQMSPVPCTIVP